jgi:hypothetical protein
MLETRSDKGRCDADRRPSTSLEMAPPRLLILKSGGGVFEIHGTLLSIIPRQGPSLEKWDLQTVTFFVRPASRRRKVTNPFCSRERIVMTTTVTSRAFMIQAENASLGKSEVASNQASSNAVARFGSSL